MRLAVLAVLVFLGLASVSLPTVAGETNMLPIISTFRHWDHHWYIWLPRDPIYEAVEVMSNERGADAPPLVWVFFTERAVPKRQVHYFNDTRVAKVKDEHFREITFTMTGAQDQPQSVDVALTDTDGSPVIIQVHFATGAQLVTRGAGLTDQSGHSADQHLLVFFREKNAFAQDWHVMRAGVDVAYPQPDLNRRAPWPAAYSSNIFVAVFPFAERRVAFRAGGHLDQSVLCLAPTASQGVSAVDLGDGTQIELVDAANGGIQHYRHRDGSHVLEISFEPPLPPTGHLAAATTTSSSFRISLDGFLDVMTGVVRVTKSDNGVVFDWLFGGPEWTKANPLQTSVTYDTDITARITLRPAPGR
jgi:hypothetical protein